MSGESYLDIITGNPVVSQNLGINTQSSAANITLVYSDPRIQRITMTTSGKKLILPASTDLSEGHTFVVHNAGGVNTFSVTLTDTTTSIGTASTSTAYFVYLISKATANGTWGFVAMSGGGASAGANSDITSLTGLTTPLSPTQGGTGADLHLTGGASNYVKQASAGGNFTVGTIPAADYPSMVGDSGSGGTKGAAPAPAAGDAAASKFLKADGTWATPSGSGASAAEAYVTFGNTTGLSAERALAVNTANLSLTDAGVNSTLTIDELRPVPSFAGNTIKYLRCNAGETALEYRTGANIITDSGILSTANTWSAAQIITVTTAGSNVLQIISTDAGAGNGPRLDIHRNSASPAVSDTIGLIALSGRDSAGNTSNYAQIYCTILDPVDGSEDGRLNISTLLAGASGDRVYVGAGLYTAGVSDMGANTINATTLYEAGTALSAKYGALASANAWTAAQSISTTAASAGLTITCTDAGAADGPRVKLFRDSASPAANDIGGSIFFNGRSSTAVDTNYAEIYLEIVDPTNTSEDARLGFYTIIAGAGAVRMFQGHGMYSPNATGGDKGADSINAKAVYDDNVLLTDYVFDAAIDGFIDASRYDGSVPAASFDPSILDIDTFTAHWQRTHALPGLPNMETWTETRRPSIGALAQKAIEIIEVQAVHIAKLRADYLGLLARVEELEDAA